MAVDDAAQARIFIHRHQVGLGVDELAGLLAAGLVQRLLAGRIGEEVAAGQQLVLTLAGDDPALGVEADPGQTDGLGVGSRLHHAGQAHAVRIGDQRRVFPRLAPADVAKVTEQAVGVAADYGIEAVHLGRQRQIPGVADVGEGHYPVDPPGLQQVDRGLGRGHLLGKAQLADVGGDVGHVLQHQPDDGDQLLVCGQVGEIGDRALLVAIEGIDHEGLEVAGLAQIRIVAAVQVGGQHREVHPLDEAGQLLVVEIELVVAKGHGIEAELAQQLGIGHPLVELEVAAALPGVAPVQQQQRLVLGECLGLVGFGHGEQAGIAAEAGVEGVGFPLLAEEGPLQLGVDRVELGVGVVHVCQGQGEGRILLAGQAGREQGAQREESEETQALHGDILYLRGQGITLARLEKTKTASWRFLSQRGLSMLKHGRDGLFVADTTDGFGQHGGERQLLDLADRLHLRGERDGVGDDQLVDDRVLDVFHGGAGEDRVGRIGEHALGATLFQRFGRLAQGAAGIDHVVDDDAVTASHVADQVHDLGDVRAGTTLVDDGDVGVVQQLGDGTGTDHAADVRRYDNRRLEVLGQHVFQQHRAAEHVVYGDIEEALDLLGMQVNGQHAIHTHAGEEVGDDLGGDGHTGGADAAVLTGITKVGNNGSDTAS
ncbi:hypothetical protein D3C84_456470 [compost metagenome]